MGLNPTRRGAALASDIARADCQLVLTDDPSAVPDGVDFIDVGSAVWAAELATHTGAPVSFADIAADDLFMLIFTSGTSGEPKAVRVTHDKVAFPGRMLAQRFGLGPEDTCYLAMPLFHSNAIMAGWAVAAAAGASIALRHKFSASQFIPDVRRYHATYANYVGKPLSYILATPERPDDADNPLKFLYGNEGAPRDLTRFADRFDVRVVDGFGSTEGGVAIARTPDTPDGSLGPLTDEVAILDVLTGQPCPPGVVGELVNPTGAGWFRGYYNSPAPRPSGWPAGSTTPATWPTVTTPDTSTSPVGSVTGCGWTGRTWAPRRSNGFCCGTAMSPRWPSTRSRTPRWAIR